MSESAAQNGANLVEVEGLKVYFPIKSGLVLDTSRPRAASSSTGRT